MITQTKTCDGCKNEIPPPDGQKWIMDIEVKPPDSYHDLHFCSYGCLFHWMIDAKRINLEKALEFRKNRDSSNPPVRQAQG